MTQAHNLHVKMLDLVPFTILIFPFQSKWRCNGLCLFLMSGASSLRSNFMSITLNCGSLQPNSLYQAARFGNFEGILAFFCSVNHLHLADLLGNTCLFGIGAFRSTLFVSVFQGSLLVIALF